MDHPSRACERRVGGAIKAFAALYAALDASTSTLDKIAALRGYFSGAEPADAAWAVYHLAGGKPHRTASTTVLHATACREAGIDCWLFETSYRAVGDLAEAIARRVPARSGALQLVPFAKACSGSSDAGFAAVDRIIRPHTLEKFGPLRGVRASLSMLPMNHCASAGPIACGPAACHVYVAMCCGCLAWR